MTNKELIKKCAEIADGFEVSCFENEGIFDELVYDFEHVSPFNSLYCSPLFPLLLTKAMYGVNRKSKLGLFHMNGYCFWISGESINRSFYFRFNPEHTTKDTLYPSETEALAEALKFYFEEVE